MLSFLHAILSSCEREMKMLGEKCDAHAEEEGARKADCPS